MLYCQCRKKRYLNFSLIHLSICRILGLVACPCISNNQEFFWGFVFGFVCFIFSSMNLRKYIISITVQNTTQITFRRNLKKKKIHFSKSNPNDKLLFAFCSQNSFSNLKHTHSTNKHTGCMYIDMLFYFYINWLIGSLIDCCCIVIIRNSKFWIIRAENLAGYQSHLGIEVEYRETVRRVA